MGDCGGRSRRAQGLGAGALPLAGLQRNHPQLRSRRPDPGQSVHRALASQTGRPGRGVHGRFHALNDDALMLPANSLGIWDIQETVRKTYVLIF
ncbi:hypothetical protein EMIT0194MI4_20196 [Pseudomonas sp. IT-194MI4]